MSSPSPAVLSSIEALVLTLWAPIMNMSQSSSSHNRVPSNPTNAALVDTAIESFADGLMILSVDGQVLHLNRCAIRLCQELNQGIVPPHGIPVAIEALCQSLQEGQTLFPEQNLILEHEVTYGSKTIRLRAQQIECAINQQTCILIALEDRDQTTAIAALSEAHHYGLTPRERDVWRLRRAHYSYEEIASALHITLNTVKKHLKSIYAKRSQVRVTSR